MPENLTCVSCGHTMPDKYCGNCGEERLNPELRSIKHIIKDLITDLTSLDSKLWNTTRTLLLKPGSFDHDYHLGRRINYIKPITLFLLINVAYVMFSPITDFYVSFYNQLNSQGYSAQVKPYLIEYIAHHKMTLDEFETLYDQLVTVLARSLIILQVPIFALFATLLCWKKHYFSADYFVFSLNFHSWLLVWIIFLQLPAGFIQLLLEFFNVADVISSVYYISLPIGLIIYLWLSAKQLFKFSFWQLTWRVPLLFVFFILSHYAFRFLQLLITATLVKI